MTALPVTIDQLEERLVAVHGLWRRTPGGGASPFARDIPAHLMLRQQGDYEAGLYSDTLVVDRLGRERIERKRESLSPRTPLSVAEVGERNAVQGWYYLLFPKNFEQLSEAKQLDAVLTIRTVWLGTEHLARGEDAPQWSQIKRVTGARQTPRSLAWRYDKALAVMLCRMHGVQERHAKAVAAGGVAVLGRAA